MSAYLEVRLFCDHYDPPPPELPTAKTGPSCRAEFGSPPGAGFVKQISVMRKLAAEAGWTHVRSPLTDRRTNFDKDFCPDHKPEPAGTETPDASKTPTPQAISALLAETFAEYDGDRMGFHVFKAAFGPDVIVVLKGVDTLPFNPGEGPRALLDDYAAAIRKAGWSARTLSGCVIVTAREESR